MVINNKFEFMNQHKCGPKVRFFVQNFAKFADLPQTCQRLDLKISSQFEVNDTFSVGDQWKYASE